MTVAAADRYVAGAFAAYGVSTSRDGRVAALWRPSHLVGLELGVSVARAALAGEPTGVAARPIAEVACRAKRDLRAGETSTARAASTSTASCGLSNSQSGTLPMGLARGARLVRDVARGAEVKRADVEIASFGSAMRLYADWPWSDLPAEPQRVQYTRELRGGTA